jgi:hypothetical protein
MPEYLKKLQLCQPGILFCFQLQANAWVPEKAWILPTYQSLLFSASN